MAVFQRRAGLKVLSAAECVRVVVGVQGCGASSKPAQAVVWALFSGRVKGGHTEMVSSSWLCGCLAHLAHPVALSFSTDEHAEAAKAQTCTNTGDLEKGRNKA